MIRLDPETLISAYSQGVFPMADKGGHVHWYTADPRGILPLDAFHVPQSLRQIVRQNRFEIRIDTQFHQTMIACSQHREGGTWINEKLVDAYVRLHNLGFAHSVESWRNNQLMGGLYGVSIGGAFFGESMFHRERDASKVALVALVNRLREREYVLLDTQATTGHLQNFGAINIPAREYLSRLEKAIQKKCGFK